MQFVVLGLATILGILWKLKWVLAFLGLGFIGWRAYQSAGGVTGIVLNLAVFLSEIALSATSALFQWLSQLAAVVINIFIALNPFGEYGAASILWEFFKNISYVAIVFLALIAGFEWILNREDEAKRMLFGILIIAFLINFTFILAKEIFMAIWYLQIGILQSAGLYQGGNISSLGDLIYASLSLVPPKEMVVRMKDVMTPMIESSEVPESVNKANLEKALTIAVQLLAILLNVVYSLIMWVFAGISIGRFLIISFLVGVLPLACIAYTTPWFRGKWGEWWQMFLTWNFNILILIILILIGVSLIATYQGKFNEQNLASLFLQQQSSGGFVQNITEDVAMLLGVILKFVFIGLYFLFVLVVALNLGGRFAFFSYRLGLGLWGLAGGALLWAGREFVGKHALDRLGSSLEGLGDRLAMSRFEIFRKLGSRVKDLGGGLRKPRKQEIEAQARAIWEQIKDKSPDEIADIISRYPPHLQKELAKLAEREKSADDIIRVVARLEEKGQLQRALKTGVLKNLCGRTFDCNLTRLFTGDQEEKIIALNQIANRMDWRTANLGHLSTVLSAAGVKSDQEKVLLLTNMLPYVPNRRNFWAQENIKWLRQASRGDTQLEPLIDAFINSNLGSIRATPAYRAVVEEGSKEIAQALGAPQNQTNIQSILERSYTNGEIEEKLREWESNPQNFAQQLQQQFQLDLGKIDQQQLINIFRKLRAALKTPFPTIKGITPPTPTPPATTQTPTTPTTPTTP